MERRIRVMRGGESVAPRQGASRCTKAQTPDFFTLTPGIDNECEAEETREHHVELLAAGAHPADSLQAINQPCDVVASLVLPRAYSQGSPCPHRPHGTSMSLKPLSARFAPAPAALPDCPRNSCRWERPGEPKGRLSLSRPSLCLPLGLRPIGIPPPPPRFPVQYKARGTLAPAACL